jgi:hypothetical protein
MTKLPSGFDAGLSLHINIDGIPSGCFSDSLPGFGNLQQNLDLAPLRANSWKAVNILLFMLIQSSLTL